MMNLKVEVEIKMTNMTIEPKKVRKLKKETMRDRLNKMVTLREQYIQDMMKGKPVNIKLQKGNTKTKDGKTYHTRTISLIPIVDCPNCSGCKEDCYDLRNVCMYPGVQNDRAKNSALHKVDVSLFWNQVNKLLEKDLAKIPKDECIFLRLNVGGDLTEKDFHYINAIASLHCSRLHIHFFTKNYEGINNYLDYYRFNSNVHYLVSPWEGMEFDNYHNIPESHVLFADGKCTADFSKPHVFCNGNCNQCMETKGGCIGLKEGEQVILSSH